MLLFSKIGRTHETNTSSMANDKDLRDVVCNATATKLNAPQLSRKYKSKITSGGSGVVGGNLMMEMLL